MAIVSYYAMPTTTHTETRPKRYKTLILILGVLVALVVGMSISASALPSPDILPVEVPESDPGYLSFFKLGTTVIRSLIQF